MRVALVSEGGKKMEDLVRGKIHNLKVLSCRDSYISQRVFGKAMEFAAVAQYFASNYIGYETCLMASVVELKARTLAGELNSNHFFCETSPS